MSKFNLRTWKWQEILVNNKTLIHYIDRTLSPELLLCLTPAAPINQMFCLFVIEVEAHRQKDFIMNRQMEEEIGKSDARAIPEVEVKATQIFRFNSTGWLFTLFPTFHWHQNKGCILVHGPHTKAELLFWYQREVWTNVMCYPVYEIP